MDGMNPNSAASGPSQAPAPESQAPAPEFQAPSPESRVPGPEPQASDGSEQREPVRCNVHHSYVWLGTLRAFGIVLVACVASVGMPAVEALSEGGTTLADVFVGAVATLIAVFAALLATLGYQALSYKHVYYELDDREFSFYRGILNKRRMHVPYQRVQSVNHTASLLQRLFGVCTVKVETAGGASNEGAAIPYVTVENAERLRHEVFARKQAIALGASPSHAGAPAAGFAGVRGANVLDGVDEAFNEVRGAFGGVAFEAGVVTYEHGLSNKELLLTGLTNPVGFWIALLGVVGVAGQVAGLLTALFPSGMDAVAMGAQSAAAERAPMLVAAAIAALVVAVAALFLASAVGTCVRFGGFRARRRDSRIEVEQGLLSRQFHGVDVDRVQSVIVRQGFLRRLFGYCEVSLARVETAGSDDRTEKKGDYLKQGMVVHPFVKLDRVPEILAGLVPEFSDAPAESTPTAPVALRRAVVRRCTWAGPGFWLAVCTALCQAGVRLLWTDVTAGGLAFLDGACFVLYAFAAVLVALGAVSAVLWHRDSNFGFNSAFVQVSNGGFSRETILVPRRKIQFGFVKTNPFQRASHVGTLRLRTAAGVGTTISLLDVAEDDARRWLEWLQPGGNRIQ